MWPRRVTSPCPSIKKFLMALPVSILVHVTAIANQKMVPFWLFRRKLKLFVSSSTFICLGIVLSVLSTNSNLVPYLRQQESRMVSTSDRYASQQWKISRWFDCNHSSYERRASKQAESKVFVFRSSWSNYRRKDLYAVAKEKQRRCNIEVDENGVHRKKTRYTAKIRVSGSLKEE